MSSNCYALFIVFLFVNSFVRIVLWWWSGLFDFDIIRNQTINNKSCKIGKNLIRSLKLNLLKGLCVTTRCSNIQTNCYWTYIKIFPLPTWDITNITNYTEENKTL